jgi:hypothetical protein
MRPSLEAQHGLALTAIVAAAIVAARVGRGHGAFGEPSHARIAQHVRVADAHESQLAEPDELELDDEVFERRQLRR